MIDTACVIMTCEGTYEIVAMDIGFVVFQCNKCGRLRIYSYVSRERQTDFLTNLIRDCVYGYVGDKMNKRERAILAKLSRYVENNTSLSISMMKLRQLIDELGA